MLVALQQVLIRVSLSDLRTLLWGQQRCPLHPSHNPLGNCISKTQARGWPGRGGVWFPRSSWALDCTRSSFCNLPAAAPLFRTRVVFDWLSSPFHFFRAAPLVAVWAQCCVYECQGKEGCSRAHALGSLPELARASSQRCLGAPQKTSVSAMDSPSPCAFAVSS